MPGLKEPEPLAFWRTVLRGNDLHLVARLKNMGKRYEFHVDLSGDRLVTDLRVDAVREIQGGGTLLDRPLLTLRGEHGYLAAGKVIMNNI